MKSAKNDDQQENLPYLPAEILLPNQSESKVMERRSVENLAIEAENDLEAIRAYLQEFEESPNTYRRFRAEIDRLLLWLYAESKVQGRALTLRDMRLDDVRKYEAFLRNPPEDWRSKKHERRYLPDGQRNPDWRPFIAPLSANSVQTSMACIKALFGWLHAAGWLSVNPFVLRRHRGDKSPMPSFEERKEQVRERFLGEEHRQAIAAALNNYPRKTDNQKAIYERARYVIHLFMYLTLRINDAATHKMGDFTQDDKGRWRLRIEGKGKKKRSVVAPSRFMEALCRYRKSIGLPSFPIPDEETPLVPDLTGKKRITVRQIHNIVKRVMHRAAMELEASTPHRAEALRQASSHWMRHTSITLQDDAGIARKYRMKQAGHSKEETARIYEHAEDDAFHEEMERLRIELGD